MRSDGPVSHMSITAGRVVALATCCCGWIVLAGAGVVPLVGTILAVADPSSIQTDVVGTPNAWTLARNSLILSATATLGALALGVLPAGVLGSCTRRQWPWLVGLALAPLIVPPQVYAYAWGLLPASDKPISAVGLAVRAGLISAAWLWPVVALVVAAGWRSTGRGVYRLALLDTSGLQAFLRAVLPSLRPQLVAAVALVAGVTLIEYAIPHLTLSRVWATELMVLVEVRAPYGQMMRMAAQPIFVTAMILLSAILAVRGSGGWQPISEEDATPESLGRLNRGGERVTRDRTGIGRAAWAGAGVVWLGTLGLPAGLMLANLRVPGAWMQGLSTFGAQWADSLEVAAATGILAVLLAVATVGLWQATGRRFWKWAAVLAALPAVMPPPALGVGYIVAFNRPGWIGELYAERPVVWVLALVGRYGVLAVLITWLSLGRRKITAVEQARVDGGNGLDILGHILLPMLWPSLVSAGLIVTLLALFEVVVSQLTRPAAYGSIAMTVLNYMHYGRDDAVITTSLTLMAAGVILTQVCGHLLTRART